MDSKVKAKRRRWADIAVLIAALYVLGLAVWAPIAGNPNFGGRAATGRDAWYWAQVAGGVLPIAGYFLALKNQMLGKALVGLGAVLLLLGLRGFSAIGTTAIRDIIVPALVMLVALFFFGPMPTPEEEGARK